MFKFSSMASMFKRQPQSQPQQQLSPFRHKETNNTLRNVKQRQANMLSQVSKVTHRPGKNTKKKLEEIQRTIPIHIQRLDLGTQVLDKKIKEHNKTKEKELTAETKKFVQHLKQQHDQELKDLQTQQEEIKQLRTELDNLQTLTETKLKTKNTTRMQQLGNTIGKTRNSVAQSARSAYQGARAAPGQLAQGAKDAGSSAYRGAGQLAYRISGQAARNEEFRRGFQAKTYGVKEKGQRWRKKGNFKGKRFHSIVHNAQQQQQQQQQQQRNNKRRNFSSNPVNWSGNSVPYPQMNTRKWRGKARIAGKMRELQRNSAYRQNPLLRN